MRSILWVIVVVLLIGWLIGFIGFGELVGNLIHIALIVAVFLLLFNLISAMRR